MKDHLTSEQMEALVLDAKGDASAREGAEHLRDCAMCSTELESLRMAMSDLRATVIASSERHRRLAMMPAPERRTPRLMWALASAVLLICTAVPLALHTRVAPVAVVRAPKSPVQGTVSDEQLMSDIQEDLSSPVPQSMLPLAASIASTNKASVNYLSTNGPTYSPKEIE
jgi:hypothetical protein